MQNVANGLPAAGSTASTILDHLTAMKIDDLHGHWSRAFRGPADVQKIGAAAYNMFLSDNGLFAMRTDYLRIAEEQVIAMCLSLFNPPLGAGGTFTSGGSESIYSALHAIREWARERYPDVERPQIVAPYSAHPTFSKGCHYFGLELVRVPVGANLRADVTAMQRAITGDTVALVGSAPCWPYGLYDPIEDLGRVATDNGLWLHVDACVGGYLAPFVTRLGHSLPAWDFTVPAVMSISADLHKFGYCPKPASTVLWRSEELKRFHYVHPEDWPGGPYKMQGFAGSRSAGPIFAAWAVLNYLGMEGYLRLAREVMAARDRLSEGVRTIPGLTVLASDLLPLGIGAQGIDLQIVMGALRQKGWILVGAAQPPLINVPIDAATDERVIEAFLSDLRTAAESAGREPGGVGAELNY